jgi:hypothetical protein
VMSPIPRPVHAKFTQQALRVKKTYQVFALSVMTLTFLAGLVISFVQVYVEI